ncbi:16341_t:CDS:2 [Funneliformis mosseae]|uniref:16341_t:CDS:1 n=1 Tax=Funneliformis mosseae TaxID=27381 RepID=A0A9N9EDH9_FUNMO|nr:16341_t:CDS:2 [Funneliformis mosseae]
MDANNHEIETQFDKLNVSDTKCSYSDYGSRKKYGSGPTKIAFKRLNGSRDMSAKNFSELKAHWDSFKTGECYKNDKEYGYYGKEIKEADKEIPNISISRKTNPDSIYI